MARSLTVTLQSSRGPCDHNALGGVGAVEGRISAILHSFGVCLARPHAAVWSSQDGPGLMEATLLTVHSHSSLTVVCVSLTVIS